MSAAYPDVSGNTVDSGLGVVALTATSIPPGIILSISRVSFSVTSVGSASTGQIITVQNTGTSLSLTHLAVSEINAAEFPFTTNCPSTLPAQATCTITVNFTPAAAGLRSGTLTISADGGISATLPESGTAARMTPTITWATPAAITYGTPLSSAQLNATSGGVAGTWVYSPALGTVLSPAANQQLSVSFTPTDAVDYLPASGSTTITVLPATPAVVLGAAPNAVFVGASITLTATVAGTATTPTGSVSFYEGTTSLGSSALNSAGVAVLSVMPTAAGTHSFTAVYGADTYYNSATSNAVSGLAQDFSVAISGSSGATVNPGGTATFNLVITPLNGSTFPATVALTQSGGPANATVTLTPSSVAAGAGATNLTVTVTTANTVTSANHPGNPGRIPAPYSLALLPLPLAALRRGRRMWQRALTVLLLLAGGLAITTGLTGCGGSGPSGYFGQSQNNYTITVTGTSGSLTHSTSVTLTVPGRKPPPYENRAR
jgi:hypothetical protein